MCSSVQHLMINSQDGDVWFLHFCYYLCLDGRAYIHLHIVSLAGTVVSENSLNFQVYDNGVSCIIVEEKEPKIWNQ